METVKEHYPNPTDESGKLGMVDAKALHPAETPVSLTDIKTDGCFKDFLLVRQSRLSVVPISDAHWAMLTEMAEIWS